MTDYINLKITCKTDLFDILISELANIGFEGFVEHDTYFEAYLPKPDYNQQLTLEILEKYQILESEMVTDTIAQQNWNAQWESSFEPVIIADKIIIKAPFHQVEKKYAYELIIQPKTSFGTGHHQTTNSIMKLMLDIDFKDKLVFDYGCGTGILAILACMLGAKQIYGIDIDDWAAANVLENAQINQIKNIVFQKTDLNGVGLTQKYQIILANINKNILLNSFKQLSILLEPKGLLLISGFFQTDLKDLENEALKYHLFLQDFVVLDNWCAAILSKN